jgi:hypothetical protein
VNYIYIIREREFIRLDQNVYKLGRTTQRNLKRLMQHSKGSELLFQSACLDCVIAEIDIREIFRSNYTQRYAYGQKYFQGCVFEMIADICAYLFEHMHAGEHDLADGDNETDDTDDTDETDDTDGTETVKNLTIP